MDDNELEKRKKELTQLVSEELKETFNTSSPIMKAIRELEKVGLSVDITILTAISVGEELGISNESPELTSKNIPLDKNHKDLQLTAEDRRFLKSLRITY